MGSFFSVESSSSNLVFGRSKGRFQRALTEKGYTPTERCAADCHYLSNVAVAESYCTTGVDTDAILSVTRPPSIAGVLGTGSSCAPLIMGKRPTWLVIAWMDDFDADATSDQAMIDAYRGFIRHEIIHAMGFSHAFFANARSFDGSAKHLLQLLQVYDADGATDRVYHFKSTSRTHAMAKAYFGCNDEAAWDGLPLMGLPDIGRNSHWDTRILRDDVMSYGESTLISSITLAAMEDTGFYLANYSSANCMLWGYQQGCTYVASRCSGPTSHDQSASATSSAECDGDPRWRSSPSAWLRSKCDLGDDPCSTNSGRGYSSSPSPVCDAQCYTPLHNRADCSAGPVAPVESAAPKSYEELAEEYMQWIWLGVLVASALVVGLAMNTFCCPVGGSIAIAAVLTTIIFLAGALTAAAGAYGYWVNNDLVAPFVGETTLIVVMGFGGLLSTVALWTFIGFCSKSRFVLTMVFVFYLLTLLIELAFAGLVAYWVYTLQAVTEDAMALLEGGDAEDGKFSGRLGADVLAEVEGSICRFYQECCRDPLLGEAGTCISSHEGSTVDVAEALLDPGSPNFCPYISGSSGVMSFVPSPAACLTAEHLIPDFSMASCEANFCSHGYEGYEEFLAQAVDWMMNNGIIIGGVSTAVVLLQLLLAVNVLRLAKSRMKTRLAMRKVVPESRGLDREAMPFNPPPQPQRRRAR